MGSHLLLGFLRCQMSVNNFCIFWQVLPIWQVFSFVWFLQFGVGSPPGNENMVNTSIYLQSVFIPGAALLTLFLPAFLSLPVFNQLCLLSPAWKVDNCLGSVNCWQPQPLISNKCFKMAGNFSTISSLLYLHIFFFSVFFFFFNWCFPISHFTEVLFAQCATSWPDQVLTNCCN